MASAQTPRPPRVPLFGQHRVEPRETEAAKATIKWSAGPRPGKMEELVKFRRTRPLLAISVGFVAGYLTSKLFLDKS